ncbi:MAG: hypothetical protein RI965_1529 [Bacteroidota bacterium]|jgi:hypothetical protein
MKFQEGDKIIVTATGERGFVVEWINNKMLTIEVDGTQFPVYADQIDFPYFEEFSKKKTFEQKKHVVRDIPRKEKRIEKNVPRDGVHLSFFPILDKDVFDENLFSHYRVYLLNHTDDDLFVHFTILYKDLKDIETKHQITALEDLYLFDLSFDRLNDQPKILLLFSLVKSNPQKATQFQVEFRPKPKQFLKLSESTIEAHNASFNFLLFDNFLSKEFEYQMPLSDKDEPIVDDGTIDLSQLLKAGFKVKKKS